MLYRKVIIHNNSYFKKYWYTISEHSLHNVFIYNIQQIIKFLSLFLGQTKHLLFIPCSQFFIYVKFGQYSEKFQRHLMWTCSY